MKRILLLVAAVLAVSLLQAQNYDGSWGGDIAVGGQTLPIIFNIAGDKATVDSPKQGAAGIPLTSVEYTDGAVTLKSEPLGMAFTGSKINDTSIVGIFEQRGLSVPLMLVKREPMGGLNRPQEPRPPYPYREEEVEFASAAEGVTMHGTLTLPESGGPFRAAVMVTGSGTQDRDEEIFGHKPFKVIADWLTRCGIAVLRYDDREFTTQRYDGATTLDYAADAARAVAYLRSRPEIDAAKVGIIGHSEGGTIAFICAAEDPQLDFVVSLAGMTVPGVECIMDQNRVSLNQMLMKQTGVDAAVVDDIVAILESAFSDIAGMSAEEIRAEADAIMDRATAKASHPESFAMVGESMAKTLSEMSEWLAFFISYDPAEALSRVGCRVLALNGSKDMQVRADSNLQRLTEFENLADRLEIRKLDGLNHMFQHCETGLVTEYAQIEETFAPEALRIISDWLTAD